MRTRVVNIKSGAKYDVYIGRAGQGKDGFFGNPFSITKAANREKVIEDYTDYFNHRLLDDSEFLNRVRALRGKTLGCFCAPEKCHGDVIADWLDNVDTTPSTITYDGETEGGRGRQLSLGEVADLPDFDGATYDPVRDKQRFANQLFAIRDVMIRETVHRTPAELGRMANIFSGTAAITARIRDLRKPKFGAYATPGRRRANGGGVWEYILHKPGTPEAIKFFAEEEIRRKKRAEGPAFMRACPDCGKRHRCSQALQIALPLTAADRAPKNMERCSKCGNLTRKNYTHCDNCGESR